MHTKLLRFILVAAFLIFGFGEGNAQVSASLKYSIYHNTDGGGNLMMVIGIDGKSLVFKKLPNKRHQATASFAIAINDSTKNYFAEKVDFVTPEVPDPSLFAQEFSTTKVIPLPTGTFKVQLLVFDPERADSAKKEKVEFGIKVGDAKTGIQTSELVLLQTAEYESTKPVTEQDARIFRLSDFYSKNDSLLSFYVQAAGILSKQHEGAPLVSRSRILNASDRTPLDAFGKIKKLKATAIIGMKADLDIRSLPSGNYILNWDLVDSSGKIIARSQKEFQRSNPGAEVAQMDVPKVLNNLEAMIAAMSTDECRLMVACLLPIAKASEQATVEYLRKRGTEPELRNYLSAFWTRKNEENPTGELAEFQKRIAYASKYYTTQTMKAYETDRGRVFLQYGKPNLVENEQSDRFRKAMTNLNTIPYEVWYYYSLETPVKQNDVIFAFVQENRGNYNYRLLHSTGIGEVRNREWRKAAENNMTTNFDRQDPNDRNDPADAQKFR